MQIDYKTAVKIYRNAADTDYIKPSREKSYIRNDAMHLLSKTGELLAVIYPDGKCVHGAALNAAWRQMLMGLSA